jgi:hypothetical protein
VSVFVAISAMLARNRWSLGLATNLSEATFENGNSEPLMSETKSHCFPIGLNCVRRSALGHNYVIASATQLCPNSRS